jgi:phosphopantothenoylcysteine decarboxylase/phosphopantothenate--cysteine ligase
VAAVADWRVDEAFGTKLKKEKGGPPALIFVENPDILATLSASGPNRPKLVIGFAAETDHVEEHARAKLARKGCDWIIANDVTEPGVMGGGENAVLLITQDGIERWDRAAKDQVAAQIAQRIATALA